MIRFAKITPCLWFDHQAEEAARFYIDAFGDGEIVAVSHYDPDTAAEVGRPPNSVLTVAFRVAGCDLTALNAGPRFAFTPAVSLQVLCEDQDEIDRLWARLGEGGDPTAQRCGWLADRFGLSWQIVPVDMLAVLGAGDPATQGRVMAELMTMTKLDVARLRAAAQG
ncbi:VOC family protein [Siculibacillus lacustris]|uniref:VOC family protein n=1 Tax=Siculibacillus lacustris TaxID=1549641 RepID=A0A4Q9VUJ3_9HYPH|nr:VOC family protein [Siculibacillus lacustris]TBW39813.1 VOC family protein [Siculibacillus lacustris]